MENNEKECRDTGAKGKDDRRERKEKLDKILVFVNTGSEK